MRHFIVRLHKEDGEPVLISMAVPALTHLGMEIRRYVSEKNLKVAKYDYREISDTVVVPEVHEVSRKFLCKLIGNMESGKFCYSKCAVCGELEKPA